MRADARVARARGHVAHAGTGKTMSGRSDGGGLPPVPPAEQQQVQQTKPQQPSQMQRPRKQTDGKGGWDDLLSRMTPQQEGDAADITLMCLSTAALVALSMQMYRAYLLATMYAAERF
ncbi:hypothetical protein MNEG_5187 [Monoraphidium neglectum]|uniref:Uncharacterized protein n=1 Tax=Monoraphidium neglectum TaxID=145388 RepID=A0A0D2JVE8_9CHLO|nr:hypothetical protein MNEG_5187 [Monoraphidium neglectum]KIZ02773.1 hypothetical protein MNEG_5187 [Monoraphidium neglectum]|eukprot:XP_013901792.1 hypothetical protein MNEG_5187 [Monoraphidium neglectum]